MIRYIRKLIAQHALQRMVDQKRNSFEVERYRRNRAAQLKRRKPREARA